jgi:RNA polymerase sigma-70 factor (ECF subfamily)
MERTPSDRFSQERLDAFVGVYLPCEQRIQSYVASLVPNRADADDIMQEVCIVLWEKFETFTPGSDFASWACRIAFLKILNHRRKQPRSVGLSEEVLDRLNHQFLGMGAEIDAEQKALGPCLDELTPHQRELLHRRHSPQSTLQLTAEQFGVSVVTLRKRLKTIYSQLMACISQKLDREDL